MGTLPRRQGMSTRLRSYSALAQARYLRSGTTILTGNISVFTGQFTGNAGLRFTPETATELTTDRFSIQGAPLARDAALLSASLATHATDDLAFSVSYDGTLAKTRSNTVAFRGIYDF